MNPTKQLSLSNLSEDEKNARAAAAERQRRFRARKRGEPVPKIPVVLDLAGKVFGRLTVIARSGSDNFQRAAWECLCECGNRLVTVGYYLTAGDTKSCGCLKAERTIERNRQRGTHHATGTSEFWAWEAMLARCYRKSNVSYKHYGARGITVCERWRNSFENFLLDMGNKPLPELTLERKDTNGNYEPANCVWATQTVQQNNKRNNRSRTPIAGLRHGTSTAYGKGCGCEECKAFNTRRFNEWRAAKRVRIRN